MFAPLPETAHDFMGWNWSQIAPYYQELAHHPLDAANVTQWLTEWTCLTELVVERYQRHYVATTVNTADEQSARSYQDFIDHIYSPAQSAEQSLKKKLLASQLEPAGLKIPLRNMRTETDLFREENLPLLSAELKLNTEYDRIIGAQSILWEGKELTIQQLTPLLQGPDRKQRERVWRYAAQRQLADQETINDLWVQLLDLRRKIATNAGMPDYRAYRWKQLLRFDYTPADCKHFHEAIEKVVVPAARRIYERRRQRLGVDRLRPWDLDVDPLNRPPLRPFASVKELEQKTLAIFQQVDPQLAIFFNTMRQENLLDLDNRIGKAPGGYCTSFTRVRRPFIFMNAVGLHEDVLTLLHEGGHAFHVFESTHLPYYSQLEPPMEFAEVASMGMELLASPYLETKWGGFYSSEDATRARVEHLQTQLCFWPYMAVVDAFQHWVYENLQAARDPSNCNAVWAELWDRFMVGIDWDGLEEEKATGWQRKAHIPQTPFYYIEYGLAQLGAMQIWRNARQDQGKAVNAYRQALSLGGMVPLPELYAAAGAKFTFDVGPLSEAVTLAEQEIARLENHKTG